VETEAKEKSITTLPPKDTLYIFESYRIFKVGGIASPCDTMECPGVQIPHALTSIFQDKGQKNPLIKNEGGFRRLPSTFIRGT